MVCVVDGGAQLGRCLAALAAQQGAPDLQVIVPWDDAVAGMRDMVVAWPAVSFPALGKLTTAHRADSPAGLHELYDQRRTAGLRAATGDLVALLEDRSVPEPTWAAAAVRAHAAHPNVVIGGALANGRNSLLGDADYLCDFYRFQPPQPEGPRNWVSYVNLCYKRAALERTRPQWEHGYYDLTVHRALVREGEVLWLAPDLLVRQQRGDGTRLGTLLAERFAWGRRFAVRRLTGSGAEGRMRLLVMSPLVPLVLWLRAMRAQRGGTPWSRVIAASPAVLLIFAAWGFGELLGYLTAHD